MYEDKIEKLKIVQSVVLGGSFHPLDPVLGTRVRGEVQISDLFVLRKCKFQILLN